LHDIGKLGVSNMILDKPGALTPEEMAVMREHPRHTESIVGRVGAFGTWRGWPRRHHERLDGRGYHSGLQRMQLVRSTARSRWPMCARRCSASGRTGPGCRPTRCVPSCAGRPARRSAQVVEALDRVPLG
jgi:hypothetical protein